MLFDFFNKAVQLDQNVLIDFAKFFHSDCIFRRVKISNVSVKKTERVADLPVHFCDLL